MNEAADTVMEYTLHIIAEKAELQKKLDVALDGMAHYRREAEGYRKQAEMLSAELARVKGEK